VLASAGVSLVGWGDAVEALRRSRGVIWALRIFISPFTQIFCLVHVNYLFLNNTRVKLDDRGRFAVSAVDFDQLRHDNDVADVIVALGKDNQLEIWPRDAFEAKAQRMKSKADETNDEVWLKALRRLASNAKLAQADKQRRVSLPVELRKEAGFDDSSEVVVNGCFDHIEVWRPADYAVATEKAERDL
jgi:division/cell wall cluster transcriptional repressor MraZ